MKILATANQKGGVGKTAFDTQFGHYLRTFLKLRVLVIDNDHQANLTNALERSGRVVVSKHTAFDILNKPVDSVEEGDFVLIPAHEGLIDVVHEKQNHNDYANNLYHFLQAVKDRFDVCIIDTNPNPDIRQLAALVVATHLISPIELNQEAIDGIVGLLRHKRVGIEKIQKTVNKNLNFIGILPNKVTSKPFHKANFQQLAMSGFGKYLIRPTPDSNQFAYIADASIIAEAQAEGLPLWEVKSKDKDGKPTASVKTAARDAWRDIKPFFQLIATKMDLEV